MKILATVGVTLAAGTEPNPPTWGSHIHVFETTTNSTIIESNQRAIDAIYTMQGGQTSDGSVANEFVTTRKALLFKPGTHDYTVNVGFYTQVVGLGRLAGMTKIKEVRAEAASTVNKPGALENRWRGAENFWTKPASGSMMWAVSKGAPLRRVVVQGNLDLYEVGSTQAAVASSGGFLADSYIQGQIATGSQKQWLSRNVHTSKWDSNHENWNMVQVGVEGAPATHCGNKHGDFGATTAKNTPLSAEKPYVSSDFSDETKYNLIVPGVERGLLGQSFHSDETVYGFNDVFVANENTRDLTTTLQAKLDAGMHVVFAPGMYRLNATLSVSHNNQVILGLGLATLESTLGLPLIHVTNVEGVRIAGLLLQTGASLVTTSTLLEWGTNAGLGVDGNWQNPGFIHDVYARVGNYDSSTNTDVQRSAATMMTIIGGNVVLDNVWLWRGDKDALGAVTAGANPVDVGLSVSGKNVTAYGLSVENTQKNQVEWSGENGNVWQFQATLPFDGNTTWAASGYSAYLVDQAVTTHSANGVGAYSQFSENIIKATAAFTAPDAVGVVFSNAYTLFLGGISNQIDSIANVINSVGGPVGNDVKKGFTQSAYVCHYSNGQSILGETATTPVEEYFLQ